MSRAEHRHGRSCTFNTRLHLKWNGSNEWADSDEVKLRHKFEIGAQFFKINLWKKTYIWQWCVWLSPWQMTTSCDFMSVYSEIRLTWMNLKWGLVENRVYNKWHTHDCLPWAHEIWWKFGARILISRLAVTVACTSAVKADALNNCFKMVKFLELLALSLSFSLPFPPHIYIYICRPVI